MSNTNTKPKAATYHTRNGITYRVRRIETTSFVAWNVGGKWVELSNTRNMQRTQANYQRLQLPCVRVHSISSTLASNGQRSYLTVTTVSGDYENVTDYFGELVNVRGVVSFRDGAGIQATTHV